MPKKEQRLAYKCPMPECRDRPMQETTVTISDTKQPVAIALAGALQQLPVTCKYCHKRLRMKIPADWDPSHPFLGGGGPDWNGAPIVDVELWEGENIEDPRT
jgi:hypothetical protein